MPFKANMILGSLSRELARLVVTEGVSKCKDTYALFLLCGVGTQREYLI